MNNSTGHVFSADQMRELLFITKVGCWIWFLDTDKVIYSKEWAEIVGYTVEELPETVDTWTNMLLPEDLELANLAISRHISGELDNYEAEFRMSKKDGTIIWGHDKGRITEFAEDGTPLVLCGILQDITQIKLTEMRLRENFEILEMTIKVSEFGTWIWNPSENFISYNHEYLHMLGYTQDDICGSLEEWESMIHPDDVEQVNLMLGDYLEGKIDKYEIDMRMKHKDGRYIWTKDVGTIVARDAQGNPTRILGGHLNIDTLKSSQNNLTEALAKLEKHQEHLEEQIEARTKALVDQDRILMTITKISQKLIAFEDYNNIDKIIEECLIELSKASDRTRISIWRNAVLDEEIYCYPAYKSCNYSFTKKIILDTLLENVDNFQIGDMQYTNEQKIEYLKNFFTDNNLDSYLSYKIFLPTFYKCIEEEKILNTLTKDLPPLERILLNSQGIKAQIIFPIYLNGTPWGFMGIDDCKNEKLFSDIEENMLSISSSLFANVIQKAETDKLLRGAHEEALISSKAKSDFLANMSHEIRTPMNAISGMAEIILRENDNHAISEYATGIKSACGGLLTIINDILDISKIESGKLDIVNAEYDLGILLNDVINIARVRLQDKDLKIFTYIDSSLPAKLIGDVIRIKQVLLNLINNSIKFTASGHVGINIYGDCNNGKADITFDVYDSGVGIKESDMDRLFEQFERVNTTKNRSIEGTGLGLTIAKRLCEMMHGSLSAQSIFGTGSTFTIKLEQAYREYSPIAIVPNKKTVLLYEDSEIFIDTVKKTVENLGSTCVVCTNQSEFYEKINKQKYDYIFTTPVSLRNIERIKEEQKLNSTIVLLTEAAYSTSNKEMRTIILPVSCLQIANVLNNIVATRNKKAKPVNFLAPDARVLIVDDNFVNLKVAEGLLKQYKFNIDTAKNGLEAVQMVCENQYNIVLMDHMMPEMDGVDATIAIRNLEGDYFKNLPIIALTANALVGTRELFIEKGMNDFLAKPIEVDKLNDALFKWLPKNKIQTLNPEEKDKTQA